MLFYRTDSFPPRGSLFCRSVLCMYGTHKTPPRGHGVPKNACIFWGGKRSDKKDRTNAVFKTRSVFMICLYFSATCAAKDNFIFIVFLGYADASLPPLCIYPQKRQAFSGTPFGKWILRSKRRRDCRLRSNHRFLQYNVKSTIPQSPCGDSSLYTKEPFLQLRFVFLTLRLFYLFRAGDS